MLKKMTFRKMTVTLSALLVLSCFYFFPTKEETLLIPKNIIYEENENYENVFLIDKYDYVSLTSLVLDELDSKENIKKRIEYLIINGKYNNNIPNGFKPIIPEGTIINDIKLNESKAEIYFSKEILNIEEKNVSKMIEAIIYTITENNAIEEVYLYSEEVLIEKISNIYLKYPLTRDYGVNKKYDFDSLNNLTKITIYYVSEINDNSYYVPVTYVSNNTEEKIMIIINELKSSTVYQSNLLSYLNNNAELKKYEIIEETMYLSFNDKIFDIVGDNKILEEVKYTIASSIFENYDVNEVVFMLNDEEISKITD